MKLILDNKNLTEEFFEDTRLLGIMAPIKDYQLCWHLNNLMGMDFRINNDIEIQLTKKKRDYFFSFIDSIHFSCRFFKCAGEKTIKEHS